LRFQFSQFQGLPAYTASLGVEYFIPWFPNLGLQFEYSVGFSFSDDVTKIGFPFETGDHELASVGRFGFHYYFGRGETPLMGGSKK